MAGGDQVRTPLGSPLGTVAHVLARQARSSEDAAGTLPAAPMPGTRREAPWSAIIGLGAAAIALLAGGFLLWRPIEQAPSLANQTVPAALADMAADQAQVAPSVRVAGPPSAKSTAAKPIIASGTGDPFVHLLPGRRGADWQRGAGSLVQANGNTFRLAFPAKDGWVRSETFPQLRDFTGSEGVFLLVKRSTAKQVVCEVVEDGSGERYMAHCDLRPDGGQVRLPWTAFVRHPDQQGPATRGLQLRAIRWIGFQQVGPGPVEMLVDRICLYR